MKLLSLVLITLSSTTSIFASPYMKRDEMEGYDVCTTNIFDNLSCYTPGVDTTQDDKCQTWLKNPLSGEGCKVSGDYKSILELPVKLGSSYMEMYCTKNEGSESGFCPVFSSDLDLLTFAKSPKEEDLKKVIDDTCKSEPCAKSLYNLLKMIISYKTIKDNLKEKTLSAALLSISSEDEKLFTKYMNELKECAKIEDTTSDNTEKNDAFIPKLNTTLLIIISLLTTFILF